jgi:hypothetical protein
MEDIFNFIKPSQIATVCGISPVRFSQKLHGHKIKGIEQKFNEAETQKIKNNLLKLASDIAKSAESL